MALTMLSILVTSLLLVSCFTSAMGSDQSDYLTVLKDHFQSLSPRSGSRFLASASKGSICDPSHTNPCSSSSSSSSSPSPTTGNPQLLMCCKQRCQNVLSDRNNCGVCGNRCGFGQLCCGGRCTVVAYDRNNCGGCGNACKPGVRCEYGACGYA